MSKINYRYVNSKIILGIFILGFFFLGVQCMDQKDNLVLKIDQNQFGKTAQNLQENTESIIENRKIQILNKNQQTPAQKDNIFLDHQKKTNTYEKKLPQKNSDNSKDSKELNKENFQQFLNNNVHVVINFNSKDCEYCLEFKKSLSVLKKYFTNQDTKIIFGSLELNDQNKEIFRKQNIQAAPQIRYFYKGKPTRYIYNFIEYSERDMQDMAEWIKRASQISIFQSYFQTSSKVRSFGYPNNLNESFYIKEISNLEQISSNTLQVFNKKIIIMNCSYQLKQIENKQLGEFLKKSYLQHLDHEFYCTQNQSIFNQGQVSNFVTFPTAELFFYIFQFQQKQAQTNQKIPKLFTRIRLNNNITYKLKSFSKEIQNQFTDLAFIYQSNFDRYLNQKVQYWTNQSVLHVFTHNKPCFIMIVNNETLSKGLFEKYKELKQNLAKNPKFPPIKFYYSDLSLDPQSTTRIKKYISGLETSISQQYLYPLLAFLKPVQNRVKKFLFKGRVTAQGMEKWILTILHENEIQSDGVQTNQSLKLGDGKTVLRTKEFFRSTPESLFPAHYTQKFSEIYFDSKIVKQEKLQRLKIPQGRISHRNQLKLINYYDMQILLSDIHQKEFFVYVNWKNDLKSFQILDYITEWWQDLQNQDNEPQEEENIQNEQQIQQEKVIQNSPQQATQKPQKVQQTQNQFGQENKLTPALDFLKDVRKLSEIKPNTQNQKALNKKSQEQKLKRFAKNINIYILNLNNNDYPPEYFDSDGNKYQLQVNHVPSMLYFSADRKARDKIEGIINLQQAKMFILHQSNTNQISDELQGQQNQNRQTEQNKNVLNVEMAERQLSGVQQQVSLQKQ